MPTVGLPPAFIPPVVVLPAASAVVPAVAGAAATGVALPVLPLVGAVVVGAAVAGLASLAVAAVVNGQLWGLVNKAGTAPVDYEPDSETYENLGIARKPADGFSYIQAQGRSPERVPPGFAFGYDQSVVSLSFSRRYYENMPWAGATGWAYFVTAYDAAGNVVKSEAVTTQNSAGYLLFGEFYTLEYFKPVYRRSGEDWQDLPLEPIDSSPNAAATKLLEPQPLPEPAKAPPLVVPLPYAPPAAPEAEPTREPTPTRPTRPVVAPPVTRPAPVVPAAVPRTTTPTTPAGGVQPTPQVPPTKTPTTVHVVNGSQIPANGPQATPQGIAQELGRIENKLARLLNPSPRGGPDLTDRLGLIWSAIQALAEIINSTGASGEYRLSSPCVVDDNGQRIERVVEFEGALTAFGVLQNRIDALAALLQEHKDLKQPICRETPATGGQAVTVNFVQID